MKRSFKILSVLLSAFIGANVVSADTCDLYKTELIRAGSDYIYRNSTSTVNWSTEISTVDGLSYDEDTATLTLENFNQDVMLQIQSFASFEQDITINLVGDNSVYSLFIANSNVTFTGTGNLTVSSSSWIGDDECEGGFTSDVTFNMSGTITFNKGIYVDGVITLADGVTLEDGYSLYNLDGTYYIYTSELSENVSSTVTDAVVVIKGSETTNVLTSADSNVTFTSSTALSASYSLKTEELLSNLSTDALNTILSVKDNSSLLVLYDVKVADASGATVTMENGEYVIRFYLSSEEQAKYSSLVGIYVNDEGVVAETFDVTVDGDYVEFTTTHLSKYGILGISNVTTTSNTTTTTEVVVENPSTYDNIYNIITLVVVGLAGAVIIGINLKRRNSK